MAKGAATAILINVTTKLRTCCSNGISFGFIVEKLSRMEEVRIDFNNNNDVLYWASRFKTSKAELISAYYKTGSNLTTELMKFFRGSLNIFNTKDTKDLL